MAKASSGANDRKPRQRQPRSDGSQVTPPPEGPHAREDLVDRSKTPGTGSLPDEQKRDVDVGPD